MGEDVYHARTRDANIEGLASGTSIIAVGLFASAALQLVISVILSRIIGNEGIGLVALATRYVSVISIVVMLGVPTVITHLVAANSDKSKQHSILSTALAALFISSFVAVVILILTASLIAAYMNSLELGPLIIIQSVGLPLTVSSVTISSHIRGLMRFREYALLQFFGPASALFFVLVFVYQQILSPDLAVMAGVLGSGTAACVGFILIRSSKWVTPDSSLLKSIITLSFPLLVVGLAGTLIDSVGVLVLRIVGLDLGSIGSYSNAFLLSTYLRYLTEPVALAILPIASFLLAANKVRETQVILNVGVRLVAVVFVPLAIFVAVSSTNILLLLYPPEFAIASSSLSILSIGSIGLALYYLNSRLLIAQAYTWILGGLTAIASIIDVFLTFVLAVEFGIVGAAFSSAIIFVLMGACTTIFLESKTSLKVTFRKGDFALWSCVFILDSVTLWLTYTVSEEIQYRNTLALLLVLVVTLLTIILMKPLTQGDADTLLSLLSSLSIPESIRDSLRRIIELMVSKKRTTPKTQAEPTHKSSNEPSL